MHTPPLRRTAARLRLLPFALAGAHAVAQAAAPSAAACTAIHGMELRDAHITATEAIPAGEYRPTSSAKPIIVRAFCRVAILAKPAPQSNIRIELWLPDEGWNGRLLGTGNGGGAGNIAFGSLAQGLQRGFATVNTDLGTSPNAAAVGDYPDRWEDFGWRATHVMSTLARAVVAHYYGSPVTHAYFSGCSTGGQQALSEAERFPQDYDGILAGAPANDRTHLHSEFVWHYQATHATPDSLLSPDRIALVTHAAVAACVGKDGGAPTDTFLTDPRDCNFHPESSPLCSADRTVGCLNSAQLTALKKVYAGPTNPRTGERIYAPLPFGTEASALGLEYQETPAGSANFYPFTWVFGTQWKPLSFNFSTDQDRLDAQLAPVMNANNADLSAFRDRGGKLLMFTGTADPIVPFPDAIQFYERVIAITGAKAGKSADALAATQGFFRYYLAPGMAHCGGGPGLNSFGQGISSKDDDLLFRLVQWVEQGIAPGPVLAHGPAAASGQPDNARYLCAYPEFPTYTGGPTFAAASFHCRARTRGNVQETSPRYQH